MYKLKKVKNSIQEHIFFLFLIILFSVLANQFIIETKSYRLLDNGIKNLIEISLVLLTGLLGYICWSRYKVKWVIVLWIFIYLFFLLFFAFAGIVDKFIYRYSTQDKYRFFAVKELLYGPIPYIIIFIMINYRSNSRKNTLNPE
jgi:hypothetical protein